ncbi:MULTISPECIES: hypothetical protein [unclassified Bosea (in: a-proteobacteria)]|uniref:hypothetical protein n=1 Tax=unclassified Bosea (in: a-proteobacteria) TaxID=2653178 RepID=UPI000F75DB52|nr:MULTISPECIES: hypothetical protein [unclassified Bosea (in: a-proteobacteria)]AZO77717.1 hypothetical protein BLM15_08885 [Bosea sp. Tri-49]RXT18331.1 hypothetical protein B5U98_24040 [Bosea sp. Tri-39]RXT32927.1 hypothetical protein B5U99_30385 [Bosea sp. Tri-54]
MTNPQMRTVVLADPTQRVPWPGVRGRYLPQDEAFDVSILNPVFATMLADKTLIPPPAKPAGKTKA